MTEANTPETGTPEGSPQHSRRCGGRGRGRVATILIAGLLVTGAGFVAGKAMSHGFGGPGHHFGHGAGFKRIFAPATVDEASDRASRMARHLAVEIDATKDQESRLIALAQGVAKDVFPLRQQMKDARAKGLALMKAPTIDRAGIETLRAEQVANLDQISKRISAALADAGEVLTPEQRVKLAARVEEFRERRGWWHRGPRD